MRSPSTNSSSKSRIDDQALPATSARHLGFEDTARRNQRHSQEYGDLYFRYVAVAPEYGRLKHDDGLACFAFAFSRTSSFR